MVSIPKAVGVLSCGLLLCLGLSSTTQAEEMKAGQSEGTGGQTDQKGMTLQKQVHFIKGNVVRVEYGNYTVKQKDGTEVILHTDKTTQMMGQIKKGDRIEAKVNDQNHALSISPN
ncbi:MAG TPA: hypothetical protein VJU02_03805 [Nitrospiraceae bacterium]|nr:hypothetical protein [Nitrospiraceae bacterium]